MVVSLKWITKSYFRPDLSDRFAFPDKTSPPSPVELALDPDPDPTTSLCLQELSIVFTSPILIQRDETPPYSAHTSRLVKLRSDTIPCDGWPVFCPSIAAPNILHGEQEVHVKGNGTFRTGITTPRSNPTLCCCHFSCEQQQSSRYSGLSSADPTAVKSFSAVDAASGSIGLESDSSSERLCPNHEFSAYVPGKIDKRP
jgi:hypothetical protein